MKGVILAGGTGSRLYPFTKITNKHLALVYDRPLIFHPIRTLVDAGIKDILIILGGNSVGDIIRLLGNGEEFGARFTFKIQEGAYGIAHALGLARDFVGSDSVCVILGDNIFFGDVELPDDNFQDAMVFLTKSDTPKRFGVAKFNSKGQMTGIIEKPKRPPSNYVVTGLYVYPPDVYDFIDTLEPSDRGELEITDVNNHYLRERRLQYQMLDEMHPWTDAGTFESLFQASAIARSFAKDE